MERLKTKVKTLLDENKNDKGYKLAVFASKQFIKKNNIKQNSFGKNVVVKNSDKTDLIVAFEVSDSLIVIEHCISKELVSKVYQRTRIMKENGETNKVIVFPL